MGPEITTSFIAEVKVTNATTQLLGYRSEFPVDRTMTVRDDGWLDLCLTPRPKNVRGRYVDRWASDRFERIGDIFFCPPGERLQTRNETEVRHSSVVCQITQAGLSEWLGRELQWTDGRLVAGLDLANGNLRWLLQRLASELLHPGLSAVPLVELLVGHISIELGRHYWSIDERPASGGLTPWRLRLIDERLKDLRTAPSLVELATLCRLSIRQLTRGFRMSRGCSIGHYIAKARLEMAKARLATREGIKSIAYDLGYGSPSSFAFSFRAETGMSPREFREMVTNINVRHIEGASAAS